MGPAPAPDDALRALGERGAVARRTHCASPPPASAGPGGGAPRSVRLREAERLRLRPGSQFLVPSLSGAPPPAGTGRRQRPPVFAGGVPEPPPRAGLPAGITPKGSGLTRVFCIRVSRFKTAAIRKRSFRVRDAFGGLRRSLTLGSSDAGRPRGETHRFTRAPDPPRAEVPLPALKCRSALSAS